jgi:NADH-quinone oxidoreductase subunit C
VTDEVRDVPLEGWRGAAEAARDEGFAFFDLLTAVDREAAGFEVVLRLWDVDRRTGVVLRTTCPRDDATLPTLTGVWGGAAWHERATAELFGIAFAGHETAPLLLAPGFEGHPLRKDFVLAARGAKRWPGQKEPGESDADLATPRRRRLQPPGVASGWGDQQ